MKKWNAFVSQRPTVDDVLDVLLVTTDPDVREAAWTQLVVLKGDTPENVRKIASHGALLHDAKLIPEALLLHGGREDYVVIIVHFPEFRNVALDRLLASRASVEHLRVAYVHCPDRRNDIASYIIVNDGVVVDDLAKIAAEFSYFRTICAARTEWIAERENAKEFLLQS